MINTKIFNKSLLFFLLVFVNGYTFSQSVKWNNKTTNVSPGQNLSINVTYDAGAGNNMKYLIVKLEELNAGGGLVKGYEAVVFALDADPDNGTIIKDYTIDASASLTSNLSPATNYYRLKIFMEYNSGQFANANTPIVLTNTITPNSKVNITLNTKHIVGGKETFERWKFIGIHSNQAEAEWDGNNYIDNAGATNNAKIDLRDNFLNGNNVYLGRDTGGITYTLNNVDQDPSRAGFAKPNGSNSIDSRGNTRKNAYANKTNVHSYESRNNLILGGQLDPFWTGTGQVATKKGWSLKDATATGEFMGRYINESHGSGGVNGEPIPAFLEIINEPAYHRYGGAQNFSNNIQDIADFHKEAAIAIKAQVPNIKVGGYTTAFPNFEKGDFKRWNNRWKLFMDTAGSEMDFFSIHLYDLASKSDGKIDLRSGSNIEATFDMMEQYSFMSFSEVKPIVISEYGAQMNGQRDQKWSPYRDWLWVKSASAQLMSLLERPDNIGLAIPFIVTKAIWGSTAKGNPYNNRLMRQENEPDTFVPGYSYTGKWVYTEIVKFYQLWSDVKGTRVDSTSDNLDIQVDTYVDGNKAYVILNNLDFVSKDVDLAILGLNSSSINNIKVKHLYLNGTSPELHVENIALDTETLTIGEEATMILEYTFNTDITINESNTETKHYATTYLKPIVGNQKEIFQINGVTTTAFGEAILRLGVGRPHDKSVMPSAIKVNNTTIDIPSNWRGYNQAQRERFFGVLEIPIPFNLLQSNNNLEVTFPDSGGHISTVTMQVFNFSKDIRTLSSDSFSVNNDVEQELNIYPNPSKRIINVLPKIDNSIESKIYNIVGVEIKRFKGSTNIDISDLPAGIYYIKTKKGQSKRFIKL